MWSILLLLHFFDSASTNTYLQKCVSLFVFIFFVCHVCGWVCEFWYLYNFVVFLVYYAEFLLFCVCRGESILKSVDVDDWRLWGYRVPSPISRIQDPGALVSISFFAPWSQDKFDFYMKTRWPRLIAPEKNLASFGGIVSGFACFGRRSFSRQRKTKNVGNFCSSFCPLWGPGKIFKHEIETNQTIFQSKASISAKFETDLCQILSCIIQQRELFLAISKNRSAPHSPVPACRPAFSVCCLFTNRQDIIGQPATQLPWTTTLDEGGRPSVLGIGPAPAKS